VIGRGSDGLPRDVMRFAIPLDSGDTIVSSFLNRVALSPDGSLIACNVARAAAASLTTRPGVKNLHLAPFACACDRCGCQVRPAGQGESSALHDHATGHSRSSTHARFWLSRNSLIWIAVNDDGRPIGIE
jgi:hypothetical protein